MFKVLQYQREVLDKGKVKPVNLVHGEEEYLIKTLENKLREVYGESFTLVWGDEIGLEDLYELASEGSMFSQSSDRVVFLRNFEDFLKRLGRKKKNMEALLSFLKKLRSSKLFLVVGRKLSAQELSKEPFKTISSLGDVISADRVPSSKVKEIVRKKLEREAGGIEEEALELLVEMCQGDLMILKGETDKLIAYAEGKKITEQDVRRVCTPWGSYGIFEFLDAFFEKDLRKSLLALKEMFSSGIPPLQIMTTLGNYAIRIYTLHLLLEEGMSLDKALETVGIKHKFSQLKFKSYLEKLPKEKARELIESLYRLDLSVKLYFANPETALRNFTLSFSLR